MTEYIRRKILEAVPGAEVRVTNPEDDGHHFEAVVISDAFAGVPRVRRHQSVMRALKDDFAERVHALRLRTLTPEEARAEETAARSRKEIA